jgi:hypothetical protein
MPLQQDPARGRRLSCGLAWCMCSVPGSLWRSTTDSYHRSQYAYERYLTLHKDFAHTRLTYEMQEGSYPKDHNGNDIGQRCFGVISRCPQECGDLGPGPKETGLPLPHVWIPWGKNLSPSRTLLMVLFLTAGTTQNHIRNFVSWRLILSSKTRKTRIH